MTAYNLIKSLTKRGNSVIGSGCYAAALSMSTSYDKVIKIGNNVNDPWLDYYHEIIKTNQNNPCVPRVYSVYLDTDHSYYVAIVERLQEGTAETRDAITLCREFTEGWHSEESFLQLAKRYDKQLPYPDHMLALLIQIKQLTDYYKFDDVLEGNAGRMLDMHNGNFLIRDGAVIVTDPWCEADMSDINDVNDWASRHNVG